MKDKITFSRELDLREFSNSVLFKSSTRQFFDVSIDIFWGIIYSIFFIYFFYVWCTNNFDTEYVEILLWQLLGVAFVHYFIGFIIDIFYTGIFSITSSGIDIKFRDKKCFIPKKNIKDFEVCNIPNSSEKIGRSSI